MRVIGTVLLAVAMPAAAMAQGQAPVAAAPVDPARFAAARELLDVLVPPATREQMMLGMITPMLANLRRGMAENPQFAAAINGDPRVKAMVDQFMARQEARTMDVMRQALPGMVPAMANAYARRFDVKQLQDIRAFFETPTGRAYMQASVTIMDDPDVAAWQRQLTSRSMAQVQDDITSFSRQVAAVKANKQ